MIDTIYITEAPLVSLYINYHGLFSFLIMVHGIWIWSVRYLDIIWIWHLSYGITSCCIALHYMAFGVISMVATVPVHNRFLGIMMQFYILLGMKAGVHMHPYAYIIGLA